MQKNIAYYTAHGTSFVFEDLRASVARDSVPGHAYEPLVTALIHDALRDVEPSFADVGALYGFFSCWVAKHQPAARVVAFEPEPAYAEVLNRNLVRNRVEVEVVQAALSDSNKTVNFHGRTVEPDQGFESWQRNYLRAAARSIGRRIFGGDSSSDHTLLENKGGSPVFSVREVAWETLKDSARPKTSVDDTHGVKAITFDSWAQEHDFWPSIIKIDVHGGEGPALRGMPEALLRAKHVLLELHTPDYLVDCTVSSVVDSLVDSGMDLYELRGFRRSKGRLIPLTPERRSALCDVGTWSPEDLYFMKFIYGTRVKF
jgi:hypothetical protein